MSQPNSHPSQRDSSIPHSDSRESKCLKITANENKVTNKGELLVGNGWGSVVTSIDLTASKNEAEESARQVIGNARMPTSEFQRGEIPLNRVELEEVDGL